MTKPVRARVPCAFARNVAESVRKQEFVAKYSCMGNMKNSLYDGMRVRFPCAASADALKSVFERSRYITLALFTR
jgi:hypothetical protein